MVVAIINTVAALIWGVIVINDQVTDYVGIWEPIDIGMFVGMSLFTVWGWIRWRRLKHAEQHGDPS